MVVCQSAGWAGAQRDGGAPSKDGAVIRGLVVTADTSRPLRDAAVSLHRVNLPGPLPASPRNLVRPAHTVAAGLDGTFEMKGIAPGFYRLVATPSTSVGRYLEGRYPDPSADEQVLTITANQVIDGLVIQVPRGGVISGRILDDGGEPLSMVNVLAIEALPGNRQRLAPNVPAAFIRTDDTGAFRVFGLRPGNYLVQAQPTRAVIAQTGSGREYAPTFYPGTDSATEAGVIHVGPAAEVGPIELSLVRLSRTFTLRGVVVDSDGRPVPDANVRVVRSIPVFTVLGPGTPAGEATARSRPDGTFEIARLTYGEQAITASRYGAPGGGSEYAYVPLTIVDDLEGVIVRLQRGATVKGEVLFEGQVPSSLAGLYVRSIPGRPHGTVPLSVQPQADRSFMLEQQFGPTLVRANGLPGWYLKAVRQGGLDITDRPTEFAAEGPPLQVLLTDRPSVLTGIVTTQKGIPTDAGVLLFSDDPSLWHERFTTTRASLAGGDGRYRIDGLRSGRYLAIAVPREDASLTSTTPEYFELLARHATPILIAEAESTSLDLKVTSLR